MRKINTIIIIALILTVVVLPLIVLPKAAETSTSPLSDYVNSNSEAVKEILSEIESAESTTSKPPKTEKKEKTVRVYDPDSGKVENMNIRDYIYGVVCGECPMLYHEEAIKAQIVAAYTYTLYCVSANKGNDYDLTTKPETSQAYITRQQAFKNWGSNAKKYDKRLKKLMEEVWGEYLSYKGEPILAAYHAISSGKTESAKDVWDKNIPYLQSVNSEGDKLAEKYETTVEFTKNEAAEVLKSLNFSLTGIKRAKIETTNSGTVKRLIYKDNYVTGEQIRAAFLLRSSNFKIKVTSKKVIFTVYGYGHGLGMSQNGANFLAKMGCSYKEILAHYYKNTKLESEKQE